MIRTKIVDSWARVFGCATLTRPVLTRGLMSAASFFAWNLETALELLRCVQAPMTKHGAPIAVLGDLAGPKIRLGQVMDQSARGACRSRLAIRW